MPQNLQTAMYADDLALWCTEEYITTANYRLQEALDLMNTWTKSWLIRMNPEKTTHTIFTLSTVEQKANLHLDGEKIKLEENPTYLGVTFEKRLTWKKQIQNSESKAKFRLRLMKKIAGSTWGADHDTLKTLYTGNVRPVMEYGMAAWGTTSQTNFETLNKVQNQASRIITGAMRSMPITSLENITGLQPLVDRRDAKILLQGAKFERLPDHPMKNRMSELNKSRLQTNSFLHKYKSLTREWPDLQQEPESIPRVLNPPPWTQNLSVKIITEIENIKPKSSQTPNERNEIATHYLKTIFPENSWTWVFTDGSALNATEKGGAGIYIQYPDGNEERLSFPTGQFSSNYRAEAMALQHALSYIERNAQTTTSIVFLTDSLSVLQSISRNCDKTLNNLQSALRSCSNKHQIVLQWIPSHCGLIGNEIADDLAKEGTKYEQTDLKTNFSESKTLIKAKFKEKWAKEHPSHNKKDPYYQLNRKEQVIICRLRSNHNRLKSHMFNKFKVGDSAKCPCGRENQTTTHILQTCELLNTKRKQFWAHETTESQKLYGSLADLQRTVAFIIHAEISI